MGRWMGGGEKRTGKDRKDSNGQEWTVMNAPAGKTAARLRTQKNGPDF